MQKRKYKLNVLDIAIFVVILCAIAVLIFNDAISDIFEETEIVMLEITLAVEGSIPVQNVTDINDKSIVFEPESSTEVTANGLVTSVDITSDVAVPNSAKVVFTCTGYKKLGRFFTENGDRIAIGSDCVVTVDGVDVNCKVETVEISAG